VAINFVTAQEGMLLRQLCQYYKYDIPPLPSDVCGRVGGEWGERRESELGEKKN
jgi:hypothetical protein